ncbi:MAG TPA: thiamine pyrophosphate-dependent enzyme [Stellaceae bacterium]|nr:thiamine pyrophosphate-dependent enzyme [Stellaceae bacterium]
MKRREALEIFARHRGDAPVIVGPSFGGRMLFDIDHREATIYNMELGYPTAMCLGLALALPEQRIFALEGDGSMLAGLGALATVARYKPANLAILVIDNGVYATTGGVKSATGCGADIAAIGAAAGIAKSERVTDTNALATSLGRATREAGPFLIVAEIEPDDASSAAEARAMPFDIVEAAIRFRRALEERGLVPTIWAV